MHLLWVDGKREAAEMHRRNLFRFIDEWVYLSKYLRRISLPEVTKWFLLQLHFGASDEKSREWFEECERMEAMEQLQWFVGNDCFGWLFVFQRKIDESHGESHVFFNLSVCTFAVCSARKFCSIQVPFGSLAVWWVGKCADNYWERFIIASGFDWFSSLPHYRTVNAIVWLALKLNSEQRFAFDGLIFVCKLWNRFMVIADVVAIIHFCFYPWWVRAETNGKKSITTWTGKWLSVDRYLLPHHTPSAIQCGDSSVNSYCSS